MLMLAVANSTQQAATRMAKETENFLLMVAYLEKSSLADADELMP